MIKSATIIAVCAVALAAGVYVLGPKAERPGAVATSGVAQDDIVSNYLESNHWNRRFNEGVLAGIDKAGVSPDVMKPLLDVRPEYLEASMDAITQTYGSIDRFVGGQLGMDIARLRAHYLED